MTQGGDDYRMEIKGIEKLLAGMKSPRTMAGPITWGMQNSGLAVQREMQTRAPVDKGRLRGDISVELERRRPFPTWAKVGPKVLYGKFVEWGTGLYGPLRQVIRPKAKKALAWTSKGGELIIRASSRGMRPQPFMEPALPAAASRISSIWREVGRRIIRGAARGR